MVIDIFIAALVSSAPEGLIGRRAAIVDGTKSGNI
jgi:hypothetical protein